MLILSRKLSEVIVLPQLEIRIVVVSIRGDSVRLGIQAPRQYDVHREEVHNRIVEFETAAAVPELAR